MSAVHKVIRGLQQNDEPASSPVPLSEVAQWVCRGRGGDEHSRKRRRCDQSSDWQMDSAYYESMIEGCKKRKRNHEKSAKIMTGHVNELRNVYLYGLKTISKLQDLREAPDAIMPQSLDPIQKEVKKNKPGSKKK